MQSDNETQEPLKQEYAQLGKSAVNENLKETQNEVNNLQRKLVESNTANQQSLTDKQKELDNSIEALKKQNKETLQSMTSEPPATYAQIEDDRDP